MAKPCSLRWRIRAGYAPDPDELCCRSKAKEARGTDPIERALEFYDQRKIEVTALDSALHELETLDPRQGQIVELRFFGGLTVAEIGTAMGISPATVKREWATAKIWLRRELSSNR